VNLQRVNLQREGLPPSWPRCTKNSFLKFLLSCCDWLHRGQPTPKNEANGSSWKRTVSYWWDVKYCQRFSLYLFLHRTYRLKPNDRIGKEVSYHTARTWKLRAVDFFTFVFSSQCKITAPRFRPPWILTKKRIVPLFQRKLGRTVLNSCGDGINLYGTFGKDIETVNIFLCFQFGKATAVKNT